MPLPHGNLAINQNIKSIVDDPIHNSFRDWAVVVRIRVDPLVPAFSFILCAENDRAMLASSFDNFAYTAPKKHLDRQN